MIYAIGSGDPHRKFQYFVKLGKAQDPQKRLNDLQVGCPRSLELLATIDLDDKDELFVHEAFKNLRVRGEWFDGGTRLWNFIALCNSEMGPQAKRVRAIAYLRSQMDESDFDSVQSKISEEARQIALYSEFADIHVLERLCFTKQRK